MPANGRRDLIRRLKIKQFRLRSVHAVYGAWVAQSVLWVGYGLGCPEFVSRQMLEIFLFYKHPDRLEQPSLRKVSIQGVTGGTDQTWGECSLGQTIPI